MPMGGRQMVEEGGEVVAVRAFYGKLPAIRIAYSLIESRCWAKNFDMGRGDRCNVLGKFLRLFYGRRFGFVGASELEKICEWRKARYTTLGDGALIKISVVLSEAVSNSRVIRPKCLDNHCGSVMGATNAADDLGEKLKCTFAGGKVR